MLQNVKDLITTNVGKRVLLVEQRRRRRRHRRRCRQRIFFFFFGSWFVFVHLSSLLFVSLLFCSSQILFFISTEFGLEMDLEEGEEDEEDET